MTSDDPRIETLRCEHIPGCARIVGQTRLFDRYSFTASMATAQLEQALEDPRADLAVALGSETDHVLGFGWVDRKGAFARSAYLRLIAVAPACRTRGVGSALMADLEQRNLQPAGLVLLATEDNGLARRFYEGRGYRHVGTVEDYVVSGIAERIYYKPAP